MHKRLIIFPFGGNGREALVSLSAINKAKKEWDILGFIDDDQATWGKECCGVRVIGGRNFLSSYPDASVLAVPGNPNDFLKRKEIIEGLGIAPSRFATIIDPTAVIAPGARIGRNVLIMAHVFVSTGVTVGDHCIILPSTVISHDSSLGAYSCVGSNVSVSGRVRIGESCYVGTGTKIRGGIAVGTRTLLGLGSVVVSDIGEGVVAYGNPAKAAKEAGR